MQYFPCKFLVVLTLFGLATGEEGESPSAQRTCSPSFHSLKRIYKACAPTPWQGGNTQATSLIHLRQVTGGDVVAELYRTCAYVRRIKKCSETALEGCSDRIHQLYNSAIANSLWMCDDDNNVKSSVVRAIIGSGTVPELERVKATCVRDDHLDNCPGQLLGTERFQQLLQTYGDVIQEDADTVLKDPVIHDYFRELFHCYMERVESRCPQNIIPMVLADQHHFLSPPKFGVNISELIINNAM